MSARSSSRLVGVLVVVALAFVAWLFVALRPGDRAGPVQETASAAAIADRPPGRTSDALIEAPRAESETMRSAPPVVDTENEGPTSAELASAVWVAGRVIFPAETPADERATVVALGREFGSKKLHRAPVAADGTFRVAFAPSTKKATLRLDARYVFLEEPKALKLGESSADVVLAPVLGGGLRGRLKLDASAQRFAAELVGATVGASGWKEGLMTSRTKTAKLDAQLEFELGGLDPAIAWHVACQAKGFATASLESQAVYAGRFAPVELPIERGASVSGMVRDESLVPISGAGVHTNARERSAIVDMRMDAVSDKEGRFTYPDLRSGEALFVVTAPGFQPKTLAPLMLAAGEEHKGLDVTLSRGLSIAGVARFADGRPASDVTVSADPNEDPQMPHGVWFDREKPSAKTDAEGKFTITGLVAGAHAVTARSSLKAVENAPQGSKRPQRVRFEDRRDDVPAGTTDLVLTLDSGTTVTGRVQDDLGAPVQKFVVTVARQGANPWETTGRREVLSKALDGTFEVGGLGDGAWEFKARTKEGGESAMTVLNLPDEARVLQLVVGRVSKVRGTVLDPLGTPVAGAALRIDHADDTYRFWSNENDAEKSDERGAFEIDARPGSIRLCAVHSNWAPSAEEKLDVAPGSAVGPLTLRLRRGGTITGTVLDRAGKPGAGRRVSYWGGSNGEDRTCDTEGRFRFERVPPGEAQVSLQPAEAELNATRDGQGQVDWQRAQPINGTAKVNVIEGQVVDVVLGGIPKDALHVTGTVRSGAPLARAKIQFYGPMTQTGGESRATVADETGRYEILVPGPGRFHVSLTSADSSTHGLQVDIPAGSAYVLDVDLPATSIAGRVLDAKGAPVGGVRVQAYASAGREAEGGPSRFYDSDARTAPDGTFTLNALSPATYALSARFDPYVGLGGRRSTLGEATMTGIVLKEGAAVEGVVLRFPVTGSIRGTVLGSDGKPAANAQVVAKPQDAEASPSFGGGARSGSDGSYLIEGLPIAVYGVRAVSAKDASKEATAVAVREGASTEVSLKLEPGNTLVVSCEDASGKVVDVGVDLRDSRGRSWNDYFYFDDEEAPPESARRFRRLPDGQYTVRTSGPSKIVAEEQVSLKGGVTREVRLRLRE
jgi:protocatechuate 3,4-dioxygenase beta subunit